MPAVTVFCPRNSMDATDKARFKRNVKIEVANWMDAIDPKTGVKTEYHKDPDSFIDLVLVPYDPEDAELTTPFVATIVTYEWPDRMEDLAERIKGITRNVRRGFTIDMVDRFQEGAELISFTFLGKQPGAWFAA